MSFLGYGPVKSIQWSPPIVLVGESNPYGSDPRYALFDLPERAAGDRLRSLVFGVRRTTYARFHRTNLCDGDWSVNSAREKAFRIQQDLPEDSTLVLLGSKVQAAFGVPDSESFSSHLDFFTGADSARKRFTFVFLPHPSGRNREWNREGAFEQAKMLLRGVRPDVPWGEELP